MSPYTGFLLVLTCGLLAGGSFFSYYEEVLGGIAATLIGMTVALVVLAVQRARRQTAILNQLPYVLDLLARAVRAGESVDQAIELLGSQAGGVLGAEFARCSRQLQMGRSLDTVVKSLAARVRLVELRILSTTLIVHRQTGGNLADTLERMSNVVRDRLTARRQMKATTGAARSSTVLIAVISPAAYIIMFLWQPEHVSVLYQDPLGMLLLAMAFTMEFVGIAWVLALMRQEM
jgi:tight adherence protein B